MKNKENAIIPYLFETEALQVCPEDKPFWYTSNTIGPFYVNTHYLYGNKEKAVQLLSIIDQALENKDTCSQLVFEQVQQNYQEDATYRFVIDEMCSYIQENMDIQNIDYISGGERRDWFFSLMLAELLDKKHITLFKDQSAHLFYKGQTSNMQHLESVRSEKQCPEVLHIADLITQASSYGTAWIPAIKVLGGTLKESLVVIDRVQGGKAFLESQSVKSHAMVFIDSTLFDDAKRRGLISPSQHNMILEYQKDPFQAMRQFLLAHPDFIQKCIAVGGKDAVRAQKCLDVDIYQLNK